MRRPLVVSIIACYFLLAGVYLCSIAVMMLVLPGAIETIAHAPYVYGLTLFTPFLPLIVGIAWALTAWGLFRLRNWARWATILMFGAGGAWAAATMFPPSLPFGWWVFNWTEIAIRSAAALYLAFSARIIVAFVPEAS